MVECQPSEDEANDEEEAWLPNGSSLNQTSPNVTVTVPPIGGLVESSDDFLKEPQRMLQTLCRARVRLVHSLAGMLIAATIVAVVSVGGGFYMANIINNVAPHQCEVPWVPLGRLGNQLFDYHAMLAIARRYNVGICTPGVAWPIHFADIFIGDFTAGCAGKREDLMYAPRGEFYLQNSSFFQRSTVSLQFKPTVLHDARLALRAVGIGDGDDFVAAHVRLGDMGSLPIPTAWIASHQPQVVLTDSPSSAYVSSLLKKLHDPRIMTGNSAGVDLAILSLARRVINTRGTFGWWGSYLSRGGVANAVFYENISHFTSLDKTYQCSRTGCGRSATADAGYQKNVKYVNFIDTATRHCAEQIAYRG